MLVSQVRLQRCSAFQAFLLESVALGAVHGQNKTIANGHPGGAKLAAILKNIPCLAAISPAFVIRHVSQRLATLP